jgi:expansin (peptidoglycan-binding protein)
MIVTEYQSGEIIIYDISSMPAVELDRINTGMSSVQGVKIGPNGRIWFVDQNSNGVYKVNTGDLNVGELSLDYKVFPNPTSGEITVQLKTESDAIIEIRDIQGKLIQSEIVNGQLMTFELNATPGLYFVTVSINGVKSETQRIILN